MTLRRLDLPTSRLIAFGASAARCLLPEAPLGDDEHRPRRSETRVLEDGRPLGPAHELHQTIRNHGGGGFSHWGGMILFSSSDGSSPLSNGRAYSVLVKDCAAADDPIAAHFTASLSQSGGIDGAALAAALCRETPVRRAKVFQRLAHACFDCGRPGDGGKFALRAWRLGMRDRVLLPAALKCLLAPESGEEAAELLRQAMHCADSADDSSWAAEIWAEWERLVFRRYVSTRRMPFQDDAIAGIVARLLGRPAVALPRLGPGRLKIGYVAAADAEENYSALPEIAAELVLGHDPALVDACYISLNSEPDCLARNRFFPALRLALQKAGRQMHFFPPAAFDALTAYEQTAQSIALLDLDVLVFLGQSGAAFAAAAMRPARVVACLGLGDVHLYTSKVLDAAVHFSLKPAMDGLCPSDVVPCFMPAGRFSKPKQAASRSELGLPENAPVIMISARPVKYREPEFWRVVVDVLESRPDVWAAAVGLEPEAARALALDHAWPPGAAARIVPLGWRNDHQAVLAAGDVYLDTFPNGGGYALFEAVHVGLPAAAAIDDYLDPFDERNWAPAAEFMPSVGVMRADMAEHLRRLIDDKAFRVEAARAARRDLERLSDGGKTAAALERVFRTRFGSTSDGPAGRC